MSSATHLTHLYTRDTLHSCSCQWLAACAAPHFCGVPAQFTSAVDDAGREISKFTQETSGLNQDNTTIKKGQDGKPAFEGMIAVLAMTGYAAFCQRSLPCLRECSHMNAHECLRPALVSPRSVPVLRCTMLSSALLGLVISSASS